MALTRLQKLLSERGVASRRKAEDLIAQGKCGSMGIPPSWGQCGSLQGPRHRIRQAAARRGGVYLLLHKPRGVVTTLQDEKKAAAASRSWSERRGVRVFPVGRLDRDSEGLLLLTNDGDFANAMMHPPPISQKTYRVTLRADVTPGQMQQFREGMPLDGRMTAPAEFDIVSSYEPGGDGRPPRTVVQIVLYEGRNRQIRRMCEELGLEVTRLRRIAVGTVKLGMLPAGKWRHLQPKRGAGAFGGVEGGKENRRFLYQAGEKVPRVLTITAADKDTLARLAGQSGITGAVSGFVALEQEDECGWLPDRGGRKRCTAFEGRGAGGGRSGRIDPGGLFAAYGRGARAGLLPGPGAVHIVGAPLGLTATGRDAGVASGVLSPPLPA